MRKFPVPAALSSLLFGRPGWVIQTKLDARLWDIDWVWRDRNPPSESQSNG